MKKTQAFTLIELLVVVLIIGILAALAVPQYQRVIWKSRSGEMAVLLKAIAQAEEAFYLANGTYTSKWDELALDVPLETTTTGPCAMGDSISRRKKGNFTLALGAGTDYSLIEAAYHEGPYNCAGLFYVLEDKTENKLPPGIHCAQYARMGIFCPKLMNNPQFEGVLGGWSLFK